MQFWTDMASFGPDSVEVDGVELRAGSRVRLHPSQSGDVFDAALDGRVAIVEAIEHDEEDNAHVSVTIEDDPGRDLGNARMPGHRFFFSVDEVEPLGEAEAAASPRVLIAGIGNIFLGDDGFGVAVARRLAERKLPAGAEVVDFGIRGMDLAYALQDNYEAVVMIDASPRGEAPGTLSLIEPELPEGGAADIQTHGMDPVKVLGLAEKMGGISPRVLVVTCEPQTAVSGGASGEGLVELSEPVSAAVDGAVDMVESLIGEILGAEETRNPSIHPEERR